MSGEGDIRANLLKGEAALERLRGAYSERSLRECLLHFRRFSAWCEREGVNNLPASAEAVARAVDHYFERCRPRTVAGRLWYLSWVHKASGLPDPTKADVVRLAFRRGSRGHLKAGAYGMTRSRSGQAFPINAELKARLHARCPPDTLRGLRDRALLSVGYDTLCRQGELIALRVEHIEVLPDGTGRIFIPRSKTDPYGKGDYVYLSKLGLEDLTAWVRAAGLTQGPILRRVYSKAGAGPSPLQRSMVMFRLRVLCRAAGLPEADVRAIGGHSLRVGAAHDLAREGRTLAHIMRAGRWRNLDSVALYIRTAPINVWATPGADRAAPPGALPA